MTALYDCGAFIHDGRRLAYELIGPKDGAPVLLMHGILMDSLLNRDLASALAEAGYRVALLDLLGHGRSEKPGRAQELRIDAFGEQAIALLDQLAGHTPWSAACPWVRSPPCTQRFAHQSGSVDCFWRCRSWSGPRRRPH